jgi:polyferredoxin
VALGVYLVLLFWTAWPHTDVFTSDVLASREFLPAESFLALDAFAVATASIAARSVGLVLLPALAIIVVSVLVPRGFCGYLCPPGTLVDFFDWTVGRRLGRKMAIQPERWRHARYALLAGVLAAAMLGVTFSGYLAAIPLLNRALVASAGRVELGLFKGWDFVSALDVAGWAAVTLLVVVLGLGLVSRRFWCRYVCPTGALYSVASCLRLVERRVTDSCTSCGKCRRICPFDAVREDFSTRHDACASCRTCGGACPAGAIVFAKRRFVASPTAPVNPAVAEEGGPMPRRIFLASLGGGAVAAASLGSGLVLARRPRTYLLRPPGSVPEEDFVRLCVRCEECVKVCPGPTLRPAGLGEGLDVLWTPVADPLRAGCHHDCNFCTQVCPTGAIRPKTLNEKRDTRMGLAEIDVAACLSHKGVEFCDHCFHVCEAAGYRAIEMREVKLEIGDIPEGVLSDIEIEEMSSVTAPFVDGKRCVGCGQCENRCHMVNVKSTRKLERSAVRTLGEHAVRG